MERLCGEVSLPCEHLQSSVCTWCFLSQTATILFIFLLEDWQYLRPSVPDTIRKFAKTHQIVIVTDQSKPWKIDQIRQVVADLDVKPITIVIGVKTNKPDIALFRSVFPVVDKGFFVGDAAGRPGDWSDKDRVFAQNLDVPFFTPEEIFV